MKTCKNISNQHPVDEFICSECKLIMRDLTRVEIDEDADGDESYLEFEFRYCPRCGAKVVDQKQYENLLFADMEEIIDAVD